MPKIKFSHNQKILNSHNDVIEKATLLQVLPWPWKIYRPPSTPEKLRYYTDLSSKVFEVVILPEGLR